MTDADAHMDHDRAQHVKLGSALYIHVYISQEPDRASLRNSNIRNWKMLTHEMQ